MSQELFPPPAPDFSDPVALLRACHQRILNHCDLLERIVATLASNPSDSGITTAIQQVLRYFRTAARHHHEDEEQGLFPLLARQSLKLADAVHRARREHEPLDTLWQGLEAQLSRPTALQLERLHAAVEAFVARQRAHIALENEELLDRAQHILSSRDRKQLGESMAARRGLTLYL
jgi:hemerythrin-like domain-containing protein